MSLRARMVLVAGVAVAIAVVGVAVGSYLGTRAGLLGQIDGSLRSVAAPVLGRTKGPPGVFAPTPPRSGDDAREVGCGKTGDPDEGLSLDRLPPQAFGGASGTFTLVCANGKTYAPKSQEYSIPVTRRTLAIANSGRGQYFTDMTVSNHHIRVMAEGIGWRGALLAALPLDFVDSQLSRQVVLLLVVGGAGILLAALLGLVVARTALAPITRFTRQTESIAHNPERIERERLDVTGSDEIARLATTFNETLDVLEQSVQSQRNLVADASHELRTPIATIRANLQLMREEELLSPEDRAALREDVIEELDELTALVADVVELARGSKPSAEPGDVRLDAIVRAALDRARRRAPGLDFHQVIEPTLIRGEPDRISRAVTNLLDNAAKWSPEGGVVEVTLHGGVVTVRDHGPGFKEEDLPYVFDRFHRAKDARSKPGSGLGLAIVRQAAEAHDGFVEAANARDGGAILRVSFGPPLELEEIPPEPESAVAGRSARP